MDSKNEDLQSEVRNLRVGLMKYSTGQTWENGESEYLRIRKILIENKEIKSLIPSFVVKYRELGDFWDFIKVKFAHYAERRKYLVDEFEKIFNYFEYSDQNNEYSQYIKNQLINWLLESGESNIVKALTSCQFVLEPSDDLLIPVNGEIPYDPYVLTLRAPRDSYVFFQKDGSKVKQEVFDIVNSLINNDHDVITDLRIIPLVSDVIFHHESFDAMKYSSSSEIQDTWKKLLNRVLSDPEGSITSARALVEDVCKYILDKFGDSYENKDGLDVLYKKVAKNLSLAPENHQLEIYKKILGGCNSVVDGLASVRNALGDAHGKGEKSPKPSPRHAKLAVNLAITMSLFLMETFEKIENN